MDLGERRAEVRKEGLDRRYERRLRGFPELQRGARSVHDAYHRGSRAGRAESGEDEERGGEGWGEGRSSQGSLVVLHCLALQLGQQTSENGGRWSEGEEANRPKSILDLVHHLKMREEVAEESLRVTVNVYDLVSLSLLPTPSSFPQATSSSNLHSDFPTWF